MAITEISRDWGVGPSIVRIISSDALAVITADGYLTDQADNIAALNNGAFSWNDSDMVAISYSDGEGFFVRDSVNATFVSELDPGAIKYATVAITAAEFNGAYAAPKLLVAAPGADKLLVLNRMQLLMTYNAAAFAAGGVAAVQWDGTINGAGIIASTTTAAAAFQATASTGWNFNAGVVAEPFATTVNKGLYLSNVTAAFTTGDSDMVAHIWYSVVASA